MNSNPSIGEIYAHPVGRDAIDKVLLQLGCDRRWVDNPLIRRLPLRAVARLARPVLGLGFADSLLQLLGDHPGTPAPRLPIGNDAHSSGDGSAPWWHSAVFYQVYPRSFDDSNGDGIGDIPGITARLDYLADLGVDCLWLSPIFDSPGDDAGYDIRDYRAVAPEFGTLADLDALIAGCHARGMRIILDLVVNHTSAEHPWFRAACEDPDGPYGDYYFLRGGPDTPDNPSSDPPNNWTSFFGGSAWRWLPEARRWALHLFAPSQMDLNWDTPAVRAEVADIVRWWRGRGIDGFRLDVINYISKRSGLPAGNPAIGKLIGFTGIEHYFFGPRLHAYLSELRRNGFTRENEDPPASSTVRERRADGSLGDPLPQDPVGVMVGETPGVGVEMGRLLTAHEPCALDLTFNFDVLDEPGRVRWDDYRLNLAYLKDYYIDYLGRLGAGERIALFLDNHDNPRMLSKVLGEDAVDPALRAAAAKALAAIQLLLPGVPFLFQGQEIGAVNQDFRDIGELHDVESLNRYDELRAAGAGAEEAFAQVLPGARDHARVPMRWAPAAEAGAQAWWQPAAERSAGFTVAEQAGDPESVLEFHRALIRLRRAEPALTAEEVEFPRPRSRDYFAWIRRDPGTGTEIAVEVNLTARAIARPGEVGTSDVILAANTAGGEHGDEMAPFEVTVSRRGEAVQGSPK